MAIEEFPALRVDDFSLRSHNVAPELCFLTHMHEDHTIGLARPSYYGPVVFCTAATKAFLLNYRIKGGSGELKYKHLRQEICGKEIIRELELDRPYPMKCSGKQIQVTLINANHCPGAAMILVQPANGSGESVLFTGDIRCERWHLDSLRCNPSLFPFIRNFGGSKTMTVYADNTFQKHANPFKEYPENHSGISNLINMLQSYPSELHFCLADQVTGYEEVLIALSQSLNTFVHMDAYWYGLYKAASESSPLAAKLVEVSTPGLTHPEKSVRLHFCQKYTNCPLREPDSPMVYFKPCNQPSQDLVDRQNACFHKLSVPPCVMKPIEGSFQVFRGPDQRYFLDSVSQKYLPLFPWFYFSRHSSFPEIERLCKMLNTNTVKSLSGEVLSCNRPTIWSSKMGNDNEASTVTALAGNFKQLGNLSCDSITRDTEHISLVNKRKRIMIPLHHDRVRRGKFLEHKQERYYAQSNLSDANSSDSDDESEKHDAMMLLGKQNFKQMETTKWKKSFLESEKLLSGELLPDAMAVFVDAIGIKSTNKMPTRIVSVTNSNDDAGVILEKGKSIREFDESTLPSPPCSPEPEFNSHHSEFMDFDQKPEVKTSHGVDFSLTKEIDESLDEDEQIQQLIKNLITSPCLWFDFKFDFRNNS